MINRVRLRNFKRFEDEEFTLSDHIVLAGPNNSGKTTLLQAIAVWQLAFNKWKEKHGPESKSTAKLRTGVPLTRKDFTALPLREMNLLWTDTLTALKKDDRKDGQSPGQPRLLTITLSGRLNGKNWESTFEFRYQSTELIYVRPTQDTIAQLPTSAEEFTIVHVPPFSGIGSDEPIHHRPYQDLLIGQGKAGDILRNLLVEVYATDPPGWAELCADIEEVFDYRLLAPAHEGKPFILCEYLRGIPKGKGKNGLTQLDIASAGSGFHQVLLLLGFFYARPSTVLLLDEPDAHLHVILQKQIYDKLRKIASERRCQLIIATHSEVLIDGTSPQVILSFFGKPHLLLKDVDKDRIREALKRLPAMDILLAERTDGVLYVEGESDFNLLSAWAAVLGHPIKKWFAERPFWHNNQGRNPQEARGHFFALRAIKAEIAGFLLLDGDNRGLPDHEVGADGLIVARWQRYEAESYLIHPAALVRFIRSRTEPLFAQVAENYLKDQLPPAVYRDPLQPSDYLSSTRASKTLLPELFTKVDIQIKKMEYYMIAAQMKPDEIPQEVSEKLDAIAKAFGIT